MGKAKPSRAGSSRVASQLAERLALALNGEPVTANRRPPVLDVNQDYTIDEAAVMLCTSRRGVYRLVRDGVLKMKKRGRRSRVSGAEILRVNALDTL